MAIDLLSLVKKTKIFSSLDDATLNELIKKFDKVILRKHKLLFRQGTFSDCLYLLIRGKLRIYIKTEKNEEKNIGQTNSGETVGELGVLTKEPRTATVEALENSILLKLSSKIFLDLCQNHPSVLQEAMNTLASHMRNMIHLLQTGTEKIKNHITIIPASSQFSLKGFAEKISTLLKNLPEVVLLSDYDTKLQEKYRVLSALQLLINELENKHDTIIYLLESHKTPLAKICLEKSTKIYIVANSAAKPEINPLMLETIHGLKPLKKIKPDLILCHERSDRLPEHTSQWLKLTKFNLHHHLRINYDKDYERILRFMRGKAFGLVLGGGGIRSWAHIGALKALLESDIPIDAIGGTSAGAIIAAYYAMHETYQDQHSVLENLSEATRQTISLRSFTWPAISIFSSKAYTQKQKNIFSEIRIENLWLPYFCISCNLASETQTIHRRGTIWKAIRASTAVPGVFPPVVIKGQLHLDGGILNNLPVDAMRKSIAGIETVIASELTHKYKDGSTYHFPPVLTFWRTMLAKLGWGYKNYKFPHFVDTFLNSLLAGSSAKQHENSFAADLLIIPDLSQYGLLNITKKQESELADIGYKAAKIAIEKWQQKGKH